MQTEIEVKFINIDIDDMRRRLEEAGAVCEQPLRLMRRALIEEPHHARNHEFIRIRDQGDKITLAFKRRSTMKREEQSIVDTQEIEVEVSDFADTMAIFREAGWAPVTYQENKRETWLLGETEVVIDVWPGLQPYIEIEAPEESLVRMMAEKLDLDWSEVFHGRIDDVYQLEYDFPPGFRGPIDIRELKFDAPLPKEFGSKR